MTPSSASQTDGRIRVLLVDDLEPVRIAIRALLVADGRFDVVGEADSSSACLTEARAHRPHAVLLDLCFTAQDGAALVGALVGPLMRISPATMIAVLGVLTSPRHHDRLRALGAFAYYDKTQLTELPSLLFADHQAFTRALAGEDVIAPVACVR